MGKEREDVKPKLFISAVNSFTSNQQVYKTSPISKFIEEQQKVNEQLSTSFSDVHKIMKTTKFEHEQYFLKVLHQIDIQEKSHIQFGDRIDQQEQVNKILLERIQHLEKLNQELKKKLESDELINQAILDGITAQHQFGQQVSQKLHENDELLESINEQLIKQEKLHDNLTETISLQEAFHQTIIDKLDQQEALTQKLSRQMDHLKSVLFERFAFITDKIEGSWKMTSNYLFGFLSKSDDKQYKENEEIKEITKQ